MAKYRIVPEGTLLRLLKKEEKLEALEALGVDNWEGYDLLHDPEMVDRMTEEDFQDALNTYKEYYDDQD